MKEKAYERLLSQIVLVLCVWSFSILLIGFNIFFGWEKWVILLFGAACGLSLGLHILKKPAESARVYVYSGVLLVELFYYYAHTPNVYDCTPVVILLSALFTLRREKKLVAASAFVGFAGIAYYCLALKNPGEPATMAVDIHRLIWHILLILVACMLFFLILSTMEHSDEIREEESRRFKEDKEKTDVLMAKLAQELLTSSLAAKTQSEILLKKIAGTGAWRDLEGLFLTQSLLGDKIEELYDYSEIRRSQIIVSKEAGSLFQLLSELKREVRPYQNPGVELSMEIAPGGSDTVNTDFSRLKKILRHLVVNALEHTTEGGVYVYIRQEKQPYGSNLALLVEDTGSGMEKAELDRFKYRIAQEKPSPEDNDSLGLGLSIVSGFTHALGGFISVSSSPKSGTKIRVSIPLYDSDTPGRLTGSVFDERLFKEMKESDGVDFEPSKTTALEENIKSKVNKTEIKNKLEKLGIDFVKGLHFCADDMELYMDQLLRFVKEAPRKLEKAGDYFNEKDAENYQVLLHSIKGTAGMIGALTVSDSAKALEDAAKKLNWDFIKENESYFEKELKALASAMSEVLGQETVEKDSPPESEIGFEFLPYEKQAIPIKRG